MVPKHGRSRGETPCGADTKLIDSKLNPCLLIQQVLDKILSKSYMTETYLNGADREKFITDFNALLREAEPEKEYVDNEVSFILEIALDASPWFLVSPEQKRLYRLRYDTDLVIMRKK